VDIVRYHGNVMGWDISVGIATRYGLDGPGIQYRWGAKFSATVQNAPETHPTTYKMGTGFFQGIKQTGRGVDHPRHLTPKLMKD
jgi:hypothetical protein